MMTLGQRIQELRKSHELSQEALGEQLGVSRQAISRWEMDGAVPEVDKLIQLARLFDVSLNDLLQVETGGESPQPPIVLAPSRGWKRWNILLTLLTAAALISTAILGWRCHTLLDSQAVLNQKVVQLTAQTAQLEQQTAEPAGLDPNVPLVSAFEFSLSGSGQLQLDLVPFQIPEGLFITFTAADSYGGSKWTVPSHKNGHYTGILIVQELTPAITITAAFSDGTNQYTQALVRITGISGDSYTWENLWE